MYNTTSTVSAVQRSASQSGGSSSRRVTRSARKMLQVAKKIIFMVKQSTATDIDTLNLDFYSLIIDNFRYILIFNYSPLKNLYRCIS